MKIELKWCIQGVAIHLPHLNVKMDPIGPHKICDTLSIALIGTSKEAPAYASKESINTSCEYRDTTALFPFKEISAPRCNTFVGDGNMNIQTTKAGMRTILIY